MSRPSYRRELRSAWLLPFALACVEPNVIGLIAQRVFAASEMVIATLAAAPHVGFLSTFATSRWIRGRERVSLVVWLQAGLLGCVAGIALAPRSGLGLALLVGFTLLARCLIGMMVTARSDVWRTNYARSVRARAAGAFAIAAGVVTSLFGVGVGAAMDAFGAEREDHAALAFRALFILAALLGALGIGQYRRVRWRARRQSLSAERGHDAEAAGNGSRGGALLGVLRDDPTYRKFMFAQFVMGAPNLALSAPFILALDGILDASNTVAFTLTTAAPFLMMILATPLWARLLDRTDIVRFRVVHAWTFFFATALTAAGLLMVNLPVVFIGRIMLGVGFAGGKLAWNLGHHDFAPRNLASLYMGVHVALTGVRGVTAPFIGVLLYAGWSVGVGETTFAWRGLGAWVFALFALMSAAGALLFARLHMLIQRGALPMRGRRHDG